MTTTLAEDNAMRWRTPKLPIWNYRKAEIVCPDEYEPGKTFTYTQIDMTAAEYAAIPNDDKDTDVVCGGTHRIRTVMRNYGLYSVFLTDCKTHPAPEDVRPTTYTYNIMIDATLGAIAILRARYTNMLVDDTPQSIRCILYSAITYLERDLRVQLTGPQQEEINHV